MKKFSLLSPEPRLRLVVHLENTSRRHRESILNASPHTVASAIKFHAKHGCGDRASLVVLWIRGGHGHLIRDWVGGPALTRWWKKACHRPCSCLSAFARKKDAAHSCRRHEPGAICRREFSKTNSPANKMSTLPSRQYSLGMGLLQP